jgi:hypothetical protein
LVDAPPPRASKLLVLSLALATALVSLLLLALVSGGSCQDSTSTPGGHKDQLCDAIDGAELLILLGPAGLVLVVGLALGSQRLLYATFAGAMLTALAFLAALVLGAFD